jgi:hypothetical protein
MDIIFDKMAEPVKVWAVQWPQLQKQNQWSAAMNNISRNLVGSHKVTDQLLDSERIHHNLRGQDARPFLKDPAKWDFRPVAGSPLIDAGIIIPGYTDGFTGKAPDLGAYEADAEPWVAGANWQEKFTLLEKTGKPANSKN